MNSAKTLPMLHNTTPPYSMQIKMNAHSKTHMHKMSMHVKNNFNSHMSSMNHVLHTRTDTCRHNNEELAVQMMTIS